MLSPLAEQTVNHSQTSLNLTNPAIAAGTVLAAIASLIVIISSAVFLRRYLANQDVRGQLAAKDEVIHTNQQAIQSFETRLKQLEDALTEERTEREKLTQALEYAQERYRLLEKHTAPHLAAEVLERLDRIEQAISSGGPVASKA